MQANWERIIVCWSCRGRITQPMLMSLMGHLIYGLITGLVYVWYVRFRYESSVGTAA